jgi:ABC-type thiamin/hydroxymethylpyrimidine transport system permease subunit
MIAFLYIFGFGTYPIGTQIGLLIAEAVVGAIGAGLLSFYVYRGLERAGVTTQLRGGQPFEMVE